MRKGAQITLFLALVLALLMRPGAARAQAEIIETEVEHLFGEYVTFSAIVESDVPIESATIFFQVGSDTRTHLGTPRIDDSDEATFELTYTHQISDYPLQAFAKISYWYDITTEDGERLQTTWYSHYYDDNRFAWQELAEGPFRVYWYDGELEFAQRVLDTAQEGLIAIQNLLLLPIPDPLKIYVYPDAREMQATLDTASAGWVAGHADPELGVIVVALPGGPDQFLLMEQRIPHELMHIALYQATDMGYANLPAWLSEGLASQVELYPNPDYRVFLSNAIETDSLIPMSNLCQSFPREASNAMVAYAQSESFTRYLYNAYGTPGLDALVTNYANGLDCDHGAKAALGRDLFQLERSWRRVMLNENLALTVLTGLLPWLIFLVVVLAAPLGFALTRLLARPARKEALDPAGQSPALKERVNG